MKENTPTDEQIIATLARTFDRFSDPICIASTDARYLYVNMPVVKLIGLSTPADFCDKYYEEVQAPIYENEKVVGDWKEQDQFILKNPLQDIRMLEIHPGDVSCPYINRKVSVLNEENECIGIINHVKFLEVYRPNDFIKGKLPGSLLLNRPDDFFTERECEIIFLKLQGISSKTIASMLCRSHRTIENSIHNMYQKAGVNNSMDFDEFCEKLNLHRYLPQRFINPEQHVFSGSFEMGD